jgi:AraC-like DNA-binding protein
MTEKEYKHEVVRPNEKLPVWVWMHNSNFNYSSYIAPHWHQSIELSYTLTGEIDEFIIEGQNYHCEPGKILVVNSQEIHSIKVFKNGIDKRALSVIFTYKFVKEMYPMIDNMVFSLNNYSKLTDGQKYKYKKLQKLLQQVATIYAEKENAYKNISISVKLLEILEILIKNFMIEAKCKSTKEVRIVERTQAIIEYIQKNYQEELSLENIARYHHVSKEYLARFFKKYIGITIGQYIAEIRAKHAYDDIVTGKHNLTEIALNNGFSGIRTMDRALIRIYGRKASELKKVN